MTIYYLTCSLLIYFYIFYFIFTVLLLFYFILCYFVLCLISQQIETGNSYYKLQYSCDKSCFSLMPPEVVKSWLTNTTKMQYNIKQLVI